MIDARERAEKLTSDRRMRLAAQRVSLAQGSEENPARDTAGLSPGNDTRLVTTTVGQAINRPTAGDLRKRGTQGMVYFATDTNVLSSWTGSVWVTTTLS